MYVCAYVFNINYISTYVCICVSLHIINGHMFVGRSMSWKATSYPFWGGYSVCWFYYQTDGWDGYIHRVSIFKWFAGSLLVGSEVDKKVLFYIEFTLKTWRVFFIFLFFLFFFLRKGQTILEIFDRIEWLNIRKICNLLILAYFCSRPKL